MFNPWKVWRAPPGPSLWYACSPHRADVLKRCDSNLRKSRSLNVVVLVSKKCMARCPQIHFSVKIAMFQFLYFTKFQSGMITSPAKRTYGSSVKLSKPPRLSARVNNWRKKRLLTFNPWPFTIVIKSRLKYIKYNESQRTNLIFMCTSQRWL